MKCFKMFGLLFASLAMLAMVGCGGGGGGSSSPATQNPTLNVSIPGGPFQQTTASFRAVQIADELVVKVEAYEKGVKKSSGIEDRKATYNKDTDKYECSITVLPGVEYRLIAYLNGKPVMSNQIAASKVQNNATITIDATTTLRTQVYDKWKDSSTNKSFSNFVKNCEKKGIDIDKAADIATLSGVTTTDFETELKKVANNDKSAQLPEVKTIDVSKIGTEDLETSGDKPTTNDVVDKLLAASWKDTTESEVNELFSYYNGKAAKIIYSYDGEKWVNPTDATYMVYFKRPDVIHLWHFFVGNKPNKAELHLNKDIWDIYYLKLNKNKTLNISSFKFKKATVGNKVYLKAEDVNSNNILDSIFMEQVNIPTDLKAEIDSIISDPTGTDDNDDVIQLDKLTTASWKDLTPSEVNELISYLNLNAGKIIYSYDGEKWVTPTKTYMVYYKIPYSGHHWHFYVNGEPLEDPMPYVDVDEENNIWHINNLKFCENKTIAGTFKFQIATIDNKDYLKTVNTESNNILDSTFIERTGIPNDIKALMDSWGK